jgi:hypothetical protein
VKCDNAKGARAAKIELRRNVLEFVQPARVFDAFCGLGEMWRVAWRDAADYLGCDERPWTPSEEHRRLVCDNSLALRAIDLSRFNVFDLDAYGSPWERALIVAARRSWEPGELGALVVTDGGSFAQSKGDVSVGQGALLGVEAHRANSGTKGKAPTMADIMPLHRIAFSSWLRRCNVRPLRQWQAQGHGSGKGGQRMIYTAVVFEGQ